jgi:hypothetical protein
MFAGAITHVTCGTVLEFGIAMKVSVQRVPLPDGPLVEGLLME